MVRVHPSTVRTLWLGWLATAGLLLTVFAGMSAEAGLRAIAAHPAHSGPGPAVPLPLPIIPVRLLTTTASATMPVPAGEIAAPAAGVTGTTTLPDLPTPPITTPDPAAVGPLGIVPARPFSMARFGAMDRARALECLTAAIYYEAGAEPDAGQQAVAQVVLNRVRHPAFPATVCGVVYQGSERAGCQFSFACDGAMRRIPSASGWARAARVAAQALAGRVYGPVGLATHYHTYAVTPAWNRALVMTDVVGAHFFHRWKGWWGTAAAFRQVYAGGEPVPGPHAPIPAPPPLPGTTAPTMPPLAIAAAAPVAPPKPITAAADIRREYRASGTALPGSQVAPADDRLPAAGSIRAEYRDSGTLR